MKKNFIVLLIVAILCSGMVFAANVEGKQTGTISADAVSGQRPTSDPTLTLQWTLKQTLNTWEIGFASAAVNSAAAASNITALDFNTVRSDKDVHGEATAYVYWQLDTSNGLVIKMAGDGPMTTGAGEEANELLNWAATFKSVEVNTAGNPQTSSSTTTIGLTTPATKEGRGGEAHNYTDEKIVFSMSDANAAVGTLQRYGSTEVKVVTQNALENNEGAYAATLTMKIEAV